MKKFLCTLLSVVFLFTMVAPGLCFAAEEDTYEPPIDIDEYSLTSGITASLSISGSTATVAGRVSAKYGDAKCSIKVSLQKKGSDGVWYGVKSWSNSGNSAISAGGTVTVSSGSYRTCVTATVTRNGSSEYPVKYSGTKTR